MDIFCSICGAAGDSDPSEHDCLGNLKKDLARVRERHDNAGWANLTPNDLIKVESDVSSIYESMRELTEHFSNIVTEAENARNLVYSEKQNTRQTLNNIRAVVRERMADV